MHRTLHRTPRHGRAGPLNAFIGRLITTPLDRTSTKHESSAAVHRCECWKSRRRRPSQNLPDLDHWRSSRPGLSRLSVGRWAVWASRIESTRELTSDPTGAKTISRVDRFTTCDSNVAMWACKVFYGLYAWCLGYDRRAVPQRTRQRMTCTFVLFQCHRPPGRCTRY